MPARPVAPRPAAPRLALAPLVALLGGGCIENTLGGKPGDPVDTAVDSGDTGESGDTTETVDTVDTRDTVDTVDTVDTSPPTCPDRAWPAGPVEPLDECVGAVSTGLWSVVEEWHVWVFREGDAGSVECLMTPIVCSLTDDDGDGDTDADDDPDIVFVTYDYRGIGTVRAVDGATGTELWAAPDTPVEGDGGVACGDLDGDGKQEVVAVRSNGAPTALEGETGVPRWVATLRAGDSGGSGDSPSLADLDGDGTPEVLVGRGIYDAAGTWLAGGAYGIGGAGGGTIGAAAVVADLDLDGRQELQVGNAGYAIDGSAVWTNDEADGMPSPGNFDDDPEGELVVASPGQLRVQDTDGTVLCRATPPGADRNYGGPATVADFDGDGEAEFAVATHSSVIVYERDCSVLWEYAGTADPSSGITASAAFDLDGDGSVELVYADEHTLWVFEGPTGAVKLSTSRESGTWAEYTSIADVDHDGSAELVVCESRGDYGLTVIGEEHSAWQPARPAWNQHAYTVGGADVDGSIPAAPVAPWLDTGTFRAAELTVVEGAPAPDLRPVVLDVCADECAGGRAVVWYTVENVGTAALTRNVAVAVYGTTDAGEVLLDATPWTDHLAAGERGASRQLDLDGIGALHDVRVVVDGGADPDRSYVGECDETNNEAAWGAAVCP